MTVSKHLVVALLAGVIGLLCLELGERFRSLACTASSRLLTREVGRPLTPVSVAGVARRSARRCAAGVTC